MPTTTLIQCFSVFITADIVSADLFPESGVPIRSVLKSAFDSPQQTSLNSKADQVVPESASWQPVWKTGRQSETGRRPVLPSQLGGRIGLEFNRMV